MFKNNSFVSALYMKASDVCRITEHILRKHAFQIRVRVGLGHS